MSNREEFKLGLWKHYKGGLYAALGLMTHHETRKPMVVYVSMEKKVVTIRPLVGWALAADTPKGGMCSDQDGWTDMLPAITDVPGEPAKRCTIPRFEFIRPLTLEEYGQAMRIVLECILPRAIV